MEQTKQGIPLKIFEGSLPNILSAFLNAASYLNYTVVFYSLPNKTNIVGVVSISETIDFISDFDIETRSPGFVIAPFVISNSSMPSYINGDLIIDFTSRELLYSKGGEKEDAFIQRVLLESYSSEIKVKTLRKEEKNSIPHDYPELVIKGINMIEQGEIKKVVLARKKEITLTEPICPSNLFLKLCLEQPDSFANLVSIPRKSIWVGASPEVLISIDKNNTFRTVALAGTQEACDDSKVREAVWTQKEIEEQALVSRYIVSCFKTIRLREYEEDGPRTVRAGNLIHLKTDFSVNMNEVNFPTLGSTMLKLLHPTSAVCGMPRQAALDFINENEILDRRLYSGFLGPVNIEKETHIFVNIRCAELYSDGIILYSGAGITADSVPEKELKETELKMQLLENKIQQLQQSK